MEVWLSTASAFPPTCFTIAADARAPRAYRRHGFETVELFATRSHFDYHDDPAIQRLGEWLSDTRLELHSMHAPIVEGMANGQWVGSYSNASGDETRRAAAIAETRAALQMARRLPYRFLVVHLGMPTVEQVPPNDNQPDAARRSVEEIAAMAARGRRARRAGSHPE